MASILEAAAERYNREILQSQKILLRITSDMRKDMFQNQQLCTHVGYAAIQALAEEEQEILPSQYIRNDDEYWMNKSSVRVGAGRLVREIESKIAKTAMQFPPGDYGLITARINELRLQPQTLEYVLQESLEDGQENMPEIGRRILKGSARYLSMKRAANSQQQQWKRFLEYNQINRQLRVHK